MKGWRTLRVLGRWAPVGVLGLFGLWFLLSGVMKLAEWPAFRRILESHELLGAEVLGAAAVGVPAGEILAGGVVMLALLAGSRGLLVTGAALVIALWLGIAGYSFGMVLHPPPTETSCGCGLLEIETRNWRPILLRASVCLGATIAATGFVPRLGSWSRGARAQPA